MLKKILLLLPLLASSFLLAAPVKFPSTVDYGSFPHIESGYYRDLNKEVWKVGGYAFNYAPELTSFFAFIKQNYNIHTVVETGTFMGGTTVVFSSLFDEVHTAEISPDTYNISKELLAPYKNVECHLGNSTDVLRDLLPGLQEKRVLFYLDAHWQHYWPLLHELDEISKTHKDNCIIVIDDFKVPGRADIPYDRYGTHECSLEYVKERLGKVFTAYEVHFLIPKNVRSRAKLVVTPKQWASQ